MGLLIGQTLQNTKHSPLKYLFVIALLLYQFKIIANLLQQMSHRIVKSEVIYTQKSCEVQYSSIVDLNNFFTALKGDFLL